MVGLAITFILLSIIAATIAITFYIKDKKAKQHLKSAFLEYSNRLRS